MHALPAAPVAPPRRQVLIGTAIASVAALMLLAGMLGVFILQRERALNAGQDWLPAGVQIPGVPTNVMLISFGVLLLFAQWAVSAMRRRDRVHVGLALGLVVLVGLALVNAQAFVYAQMDMPIADSAYAGMFYAITGTMLALIVAGLAFTAVTAFRVLGGRDDDHELVASHALYWYVLSAGFAALWLIVFVTK